MHQHTPSLQSFPQPLNAAGPGPADCFGPPTGTRFTRLAVVAAVHVLAVVALLHTMKVQPTPPAPPEIDVTVVKPLPMVEPQPIDPPPVPQAAQPQSLPVVPMPDVTFDQPRETITVRQATEIPSHPPSIGKTGPEVIDAPPGPAKPAVADSGPMRTAVLADANSCARPEYPARSVRNGDTGTVVLALLVEASGKVSQARVQQSSGHRELDRAAIAALSLCKFQPATRNGVAEAGWGRIAYAWTLD